MMIEANTYDKISLLRLAFKGLDESELQEMAELTQLRMYPPEHVLCHEGAYEDVFYIVAEGSLVITKKMLGETGERVLRVGGRGDLVGEMALIQNAPRAATVRTLTECTMLEMGKKDFESILSKSPRMAIDIIRITLDRMRANDHMAIADLQRTNNILRQLDRNKMDFIQVVAHELRTPLTVLNGYIKILRSSPDIKANASLSTMIEGIITGTDRIHEVVNLMLDVTRIDTETLRVVAESVPLQQLIHELVQNLSPVMEGRKLEIIVDYAAETPQMYGDPTLILKALYQLVINAIKYTPDGGKVKISTSPCRIEDEIPGVQIKVSDTGIGIDAEHHELVFEKFYQVGSVTIHSSGKTTFKGGGSGLGLAIVRGVARAHGGKAWVESPGHNETNFPGSIFYLQLPINPINPVGPSSSTTLRTSRT
ncbi:MAG TPA: ATP-binding protein [Anaerolineales bacterium]|jgi:signal transduction histidine kinase|nr:ATP-binding protein [Anaerolineales bacterium]